MTIRHKLTLLFTLITAALLSVFSVFVYINYTENREDEFFRQLRLQAVIKANLLLDAQVDPEILQLIYQRSRIATFQEEVAIYDTNYDLLYHDAVEIDFVKESPEMLKEISEKGRIEFFQDNWQVVGFRFFHGGQTYLITAAAYDQYGYTKAEYLRYSIILGLLLSIIVCYFLGYFYSKQSLKPVSEMVDKVEEITATNLDLRVNEGKGRDEIAELAVTFNKMLDRLENSFDAQKNFVLNLSHEIRTPLSTIIAELELARSRKRTEEEYHEAMELALTDAQKISKLVNSLLDLAKASYDKSSITYKSLRVDEALMDARLDLTKIHPDYTILLYFDQEMDENAEVSILGNEYLLKVAFMNLLENACKFSDNKTCKVLIKAKDRKLSILFSDHGLGIMEEDLQNIFKPFFRGKNMSKSKGYGIGLYLTQKIVHLHSGKILIDSKSGAGTKVLIVFGR